MGGDSSVGTVHRLATGWTARGSNPCRGKDIYSSPRPSRLALGIEAAGCRGQLKCDGTRAETRFRLSEKRTSLFKSAGASVQSTTGSRGVRISGSNAVYTMFRGSVKGTGYPLHSAVSPFTSPPVRHRVPSHFIWSLQ